MSDLIGRVLTTCPRSGLTVNTVYRMRLSAFESFSGQYRFRCARCGDIHVWGRDDAWMEGAEATTRRPRAEPVA